VDSKDETIVYFNDEATQAVDLKFDASKKINDKINLYTIFDSAPQQRFAINGVKQVGCSSSFRLGINDWDSNGLPVTPSGNYKFNFSEMESFTSSESFLLKDNFTGVTIDLMTSPTYDFEVSSNPNSYGDLRFELLVINNAPDPSLTVTPLVSEPSCKAGSVTLIVDGAPVGGSYKWYDSKDSPLAIQGETSSEFITPALEKSKTYFVESLNAEGCRSNRIPVVAEVVNFDDAVITENESTLTSNYTAGNQWYRDGVLITGANEQVFKPEESGLYKVEVSIGSCKTLAERSFTVTGLEDDTFFKDFVQIYPNPVSKDLTIKIRHEISGTPRIINLNGGEIGVFELKKQDDGLIGVYNFEGKAAGVYLLQIADKKGKIFYKRVIKK
jgi:hypothetical protein